MNNCQRTSSQDQPTVRAACEGCDGTLNLVGIAHVHGAHLDCDGGRHGLNCRPQAKAGTDRRITQNRGARDVWRDLLSAAPPILHRYRIRKAKSRSCCRPVEPDYRRSPAPTGSGTFVNTIGTVRVARRNGAAPALPVVKMTSGASATSSAAYFRVSSSLPPAQR